MTICFPNQIFIPIGRVVRNGTNRRGARKGAERVLKAVRAMRIPLEGGEFGFTLSVGTATYPDDAATREELVRLADRALYAAKHGGRNRAVAAHEVGDAPGAPGSDGEPAP